MSESRDQMISALKAVIVPKLRDRGFSGSFPHFRRLRSDRIELFTFQFDRHGGSFVIEIGQCAPEGFTTHWGKQIGSDKVTAWDLPPQKRARIGPKSGSGVDSWFRYDRSTAVQDVFALTAESVFPFLDIAEKMFGNFETINKLG